MLNGDISTLLNGTMDDLNVQLALQILHKLHTVFLPTTLKTNGITHAHMLQIIPTWAIP